jgi:hypothetical protein
MKCGIPRRMCCNRPESKHRQRLVKICKTFALSLTWHRATVDAGCVQFYYYTCVPVHLRSGSYLSLSSGGILA